MGYIYTRKSYVIRYEVVTGHGLRVTAASRRWANSMSHSMYLYNIYVFLLKIILCQICFCFSVVRSFGS